MIVTIILIVIAVVAGQTALPGSPETHRRPLETHHSLHQPFDQTSVYWKYGGHTVMTSKAIRLTPATQSSIGWIWNDYPLESPNWEVEVGFRVFSKPHFGGDGFGFWVLSSDMDPSYQTSASLSGPLFGLRDDFKGFGVIFDTYDNDGRRDNPSVYVVKNTEGRFLYNNDNDLADNYIRDSPSNLAFKCTADYRNLGKPIKVLFRYSNRVLHVYIDDTMKERGYKFCLAVNVDLDSKISEKHFAFTAMTGEVADAVELTHISTHYLDDQDADIADNLLEHSDSVGGSKWRWSFWAIALMAGVFFFGWTVRDIVKLSSFQKSHVNPVYICNELNAWMLTHYYLHLGLCALLLISGKFLGLFLNAPLALYRIMSIVQKSYTLDPAVLTGGSHKGHAKPKLSYTTQLYITAVLYLIPLFYYLVQLVN